MTFFLSYFKQAMLDNRTRRFFFCLFFARVIYKLLTDSTETNINNRYEFNQVYKESVKLILLNKFIDNQIFLSLMSYLNCTNFKNCLHF